MSKSKKPSRHRATTPRTPADFAAKVLTAHLSNGQLYWEVLDQLSGDDFVELENAVLATVEDANPSHEQDNREMARQEVSFMLGLEIGRRLGGAK